MGIPALARREGANMSIQELPVVELHSTRRSWPQDRIAELKRELAGGLSYSLIAARMGTTRNGISGIVYRLGLSDYAKNSVTEPRKHSPSISKRPRTSSGRLRRKSTGGLPIEAAPALNGDEPTDIVVEFIPPNPVTFAQLGEDHCRFPVSDSPVMFCGERPKEDRPYCTAHCRICYKPSSGAKPWVPGRVEG